MKNAVESKAAYCAKKLTENKIAGWRTNKYRKIGKHFQANEKLAPSIYSFCPTWLNNSSLFLEKSFPAENSFIKTNKIWILSDFFIHWIFEIQGCHWSAILAICSYFENRSYSRLFCSKIGYFGYFLIFVVLCKFFVWMKSIEWKKK